MKLTIPAGLILLTSIALGLATYNTKLVEPTKQISPASVQKSFPIRSGEYTLFFNDRLLGKYSNTLLPAKHNYLPLLPILEAMEVDYQWNRSNNIVAIANGEKTVHIQVGETIMTGKREQIPTVFNGEIWIYASKDLPGRLGIDHISVNQLEKEWKIYSFQEQTDRETPLEKAALDLVKDYLAMEDLARSIPIDSEGWSRLLTPNTQITPSSFDPEEPKHCLKNIGSISFWKIPKLFDDLISILLSRAKNISVKTECSQDIEIKNAVQLTPTDNLNQGAAKVVVRYTTDYNGQPSKHFPGLGYTVPGKTRHEKVFLVIADEGEILIDDVIAHRMNRTSNGAPIPWLEEEDYIEIAQEWQRKSPNASYSDLLSICNKFITPTLTRVNTNNKLRLRALDDEAVLARFSEEVRQSQGWKDFVSLEGARDPFFQEILEATYDGYSLSATLVGNWQSNATGHITPIRMEVELVRDKNNSWKFTRLANVRLYQNLRELELNDPETYSKLARLYSYRRDRGMGLGLFR